MGIIIEPREGAMGYTHKGYVMKILLALILALTLNAFTRQCATSIDECNKYTKLSTMALERDDIVMHDFYNNFSIYHVEQAIVDCPSYMVEDLKQMRKSLIGVVK